MPALSRPAAMIRISVWRSSTHEPSVTFHYSSAMESTFGGKTSPTVYQISSLCVIWGTIVWNFIDSNLRLDLARRCQAKDLGIEALSQKLIVEATRTNQHGSITSHYDVKASHRSSRGFVFDHPTLLDLFSITYERKPCLPKELRPMGSLGIGFILWDWL